MLEPLMRWQPVWTVWIMLVIRARLYPKATPIKGYHTTPEHMNIPPLKSIVPTSGSKAVLR
jgi:hypothetical protein